MSMQEFPVVTVVTLVYNTGKFVVRGLDSLLAQTYPKDKIDHIIIDDCSSDDSVQTINNWLASHQDHSANFIIHHKNYGLCKGLNEGLALAKGKYVAPMSDDLWKPEKLHASIGEFEKLPTDYAIVYTPIDVCNEDDEVYMTDVIQEPRIIPEDMFIECITNSLVIPGVTSIYRTSALIDIGGFDERLTFEDTDIVLRLCSRYKFYLYNQSLTIYRKNLKNPNSISDKHIKNPGTVIDFLKMNANALGQSIERDNLLASAYLDQMEVWYLYRYNRRFSLRKTRNYSTAWVKSRLSIYRDKRQFRKYYFLLCQLLFKKYTPYNLRDIFFLLRKYYDKDFRFF